MQAVQIACTLRHPGRQMCGRLWLQFLLRRLWGQLPLMSFKILLVTLQMGQLIYALKLKVNVDADPFLLQSWGSVFQPMRWLFVDECDIPCSFLDKLLIELNVMVA